MGDSYPFSTVLITCWQAAAFHRLSVNIKQLFLANCVVDSAGNFVVFSTDWDEQPSTKVEQCRDATYLTASSSSCWVFIIYLRDPLLFSRELRKLGSADLQRQSHQPYFLRDIRICPPPLPSEAGRYNTLQIWRPKAVYYLLQATITSEVLRAYLNN